MFSDIRRVFGSIQVEEVNGLITIDGLPADVITKDIYKIWGTQKIVENMFTKVGRSSLTFRSFFAPDIAYTFSVVLRKHAGKVNFRAISAALELLYTNTWLKATREEHPSKLDYHKLSELTVTLLPKQREFLEMYDRETQRYQLKGYLLGAAPGTGKTIAGIALGVVTNADVVIAIVPKNSLDRVWGSTISSVFKKPRKYWVSSTPGEPEPGCSHYVFHYERLEQAQAFFRRYRPKNALVLLDESHNFNETTAQRTNQFIELCLQTQAANVLWASGTPIKAIGNEALPLLRTIDPLFDPDSQNSFKAIFGKSATRAIDILRARLGLVTFKVDKSQIVDNKAKAQDIKVQIPNSQRFTLDAVKLEMQAFVTKQMAHYKKEFPAYLRIYEQGVATYQSTLRTSQDTKEFKLYKEYIAQIRKGYDPVTMKEMVIFCNKYELARIVPALQQKDKEAFKNARSVVKYYNLKVQGEALGRVLGRLRAECHVEMVPHCKLEELVSNSAKKTVIFTDYTEALRAAEVYMKAQGFKPLVVYGETNHDLKNIVAKFESDPKANPLIATFKSLSTAVPLVMANTVVLLNSPFRAHDYEQATSRVDRIGQDTPVRIFNTYLDTGDKPNISTRSQEIMQWSKDQIEKMFSNDSILGNVAVEALVDFAEEFALESYFIRPLQAPAWASW